MIQLSPAKPSFEALKAMAASGSSGVAKRAQAALKSRTTEALRRAVGG